MQTYRISLQARGECSYRLCEKDQLQEPPIHYIASYLLAII